MGESWIAFMSRYKFIYLLIAILLLAYTGYRAGALALTCDEAWTYQVAEGESFQSLIRYDNYISSNNHLLNSVLVKISLSAFGHGELSLRWPNVAAHVLFLLFSFLILNRYIQTPWIALLGFLFLNANPYMLDFFSLSRGYGLGLGFQMMCLYFLLVFLEEEKWRALIWSLLGGSLAVLSNFGFLNFYLPVISVLGIYFLINLKKGKGILQQKKWLGISLLFVFLLSLIIAGPLKRLLGSDQFYFVGNEGFWEDTVRSLVETYFYSSYSSNHQIVLSVFVLLTFLGAFIMTVRGLSLQLELRPFLALTLVLCFTILSPILQNWLLDGFFPRERYAQFYIPLWFLTTVFLFDELHSLLKNTKFMLGLHLVLLAFLVVHLTISLNFRQTRDWNYDAGIKAAFQDIKTDVKTAGWPPSAKVKLGTHLYSRPASDYYKSLMGLDWMAPMEEDSYLKRCDYYYLSGWHLEQIPQFPLVKLKNYPGSGAALYRWKE